ncbi:MAG: dethiobiotin synthase [Parachlamydiaceae bacterium]
MKNWNIVGIGTNVGKTIVSTILTTSLQASYWKPIQTGLDSDTATLQRLIPDLKTFPPVYHFKAPLSPHHASRLEGKLITVENIQLPYCHHSLVIEGAGGILTPLNLNTTVLDLFLTWPAHWVVVTRHYLGSINHTLMTLEILHARGIKRPYLIFNGNAQKETEEAILAFSQAQLLGRLLPEKTWNDQLINRYADKWKKNISF